MNSGFMGRLLRKWTDHESSDSAATRFRIKRLAAFSALLARLPCPVRMLDIGGDPKIWIAGAGAGCEDVEVIVINVQRQGGADGAVRVIQADARHLPFLPDCSFDVVFSNSVIEHVGAFEDQRQMAAEIMRIGKRFFLQTPSKWFPLEPHFLFPAFQFFPFSWRVWIASHYKGGWYCHPGNPDAARKEVESIRLLTKRDCRHLFPGAEIRTERFFGLTKSYLILGGWGTPAEHLE